MFAPTLKKKGIKRIKEKCLSQRVHENQNLITKKILNQPKSTKNTFSARAKVFHIQYFKVHLNKRFSGDHCKAVIFKVSINPKLSFCLCTTS